MGRLFQDMIDNGIFFRLKSYLYVTFVVDTTDNDELVDKLSCQFFEQFFHKIRKNLLMNGRDCDIRVQFMWYKRNKGDYCGDESIFFKLPEEFGCFTDYITNTVNGETQFIVNSVCSVLKRCLNHMFKNDGSKERQIIVFLSDKEDDICPNDIRETEITNFSLVWQGTAPLGEERNYRRRRLCFITPCVYPYSELEIDLENTLLIDIGQKSSWSEWKGALDSLIDALY